MYSAVVLNEESRERLLNALGNRIPACHTDVIAHHMTICMGPMPAHMKHLIGTERHLIATHFAINDKVCAVALGADLYTVNKVPHITIAVNREAGGKPKDSNDFKHSDWLPLKDCIELVGTFEEVSS